MNQAKRTFGWPARLFFLLLALAVIGFAGRDNWGLMFSSKNVIMIVAVFAVVVGWSFLDRRRRRNLN